MSRPLDGIRVLDLTRILAGPWATQCLADLGAEVIKIERPGRGDDTRSWGPPWLADAAGRPTSESAYFLSVNRGKKSVTLDLATPDGARLVRELAARSDVLVENYKVGDLERRGLGWDHLRRLNPGLVYCSVTGFGQTGPRAKQPGYDFVFQGLGGLMSLTGEPDGRPGAGPLKVGIAVSDVVGGLYASLAIVAALVHRRATGEGQRIDLGLYDSVVALLASQVVGHWCSGEVPGRHGNAHPNIVPYQVVETADRPLVLAVGNDAQFAAFAEAAGRPELAADPRFRTNPDRVRHRAALVPMIAELMRGRTADDWIAVLEPAGVPCAPIRDVAEAAADPQALARGLRVSLPHAAGVDCSTVASPMRFSATPVAHGPAPPRLGQHTREVLGELLGLGDEHIDALAAAGVI